MPKKIALPAALVFLPYKLKGTSTFCLLMGLALVPSAGFAHDAQEKTPSIGAGNTPAYYENLCVAQINHGNEGDEWLDALGRLPAIGSEIEEVGKNGQFKEICRV